MGLEKAKELRIVSISGGKDSAAVYLWAKEQFGPDGFLAVFADVGNEHPVTLNYLRNFAQMANGPEIHFVKRDFTKELKNKNLEPTGSAFLDMLLVKTMMPSGNRQFCTTLLKLEPIRDWMNSVRGDAEVILYLGIRAQESLKRSRLPEKEFSDYYDCLIERPILKWKTEEVFAILDKHGVERNPLYAAGMHRVGCYPCINTNKSELATLPDWVWEKIKEWEKVAQVHWFKPFLVPGKARPSVDDVKKWCRTGKDRKLDPSAPDVNDVPSCMSTWGACE